ncbi:sigma-54 dependent transcriptional regulator [Microaerobacter geothermalis]|uniref:sigma-54-dependent transcriptional regulator n=1 Tax=Microaerobacter geothermalis TaxID=674972 RepID=UPI001F317E5C|nr:sigma-54 dependent transcriptional regulator [Microaerobacter geothermalis]MCF6094586.1 sigma-54 dependent transcriptional regulator [Microaerobacter geothermalis]
MKHHILIIDDEQAICSSLHFALEDEYEVMTTTSPSIGLQYLSEKLIDVVLLDWRLGEIDGLTILEKIKRISPQTAVIMMTAFGTIESSVQAIKMGAYYYITKPLDMKELSLLIQKGIEFQKLNRQVQWFQETLDKVTGYAGIIGKSKAIKQVFHLIDKVKDIDTNVLITGESGTGKELVARAIHSQGKRGNEPFEVVNCAAIPETLLESEFFGYEKGAFTGAVQSKKGKILAANRGTLFLDEVGEMPLHLQAKLLRVIQEREVTPLGSNEKKQVDIRIIAATNRNLMEMVSNGLFREDLYFRLNVIPIPLPPLRDRKEDIPLLLDHFLHQYCEEIGTEKKQFSSEAKKVLFQYHYPGNIRQLSNMIQYAVALSPERMISIEDLPPYLMDNERITQEIKSDPKNDHKSIIIPIGTTIKEAEKQIIQRTLSWCNGHRQKTAKILGISERSLRDKLKHYRT